jgi:hypothetical protein
MPTVIFTVDCESAHENRHCYTRDLAKVAEEFNVPITWMIYVSGKDPMSNVLLYHQEYLHRIPSWHEQGLHLHFEDDNGFVEDPTERAEMIRMGKDVLKSCHVKPTAFRAGSFALLPSDIKVLEDVGFIVDSSAVPQANYKMFVDWTGAPTQPYRLSNDSVITPGNSTIMELPVATLNGSAGYLNGEFGAIKPVLEYHADNSEVIVLGAYDYKDSAETLREAIIFFKSKHARFATLTSAALELSD